VELQSQSKKQGGSTGKRPSNLCHQVLILCMGDSGCLGLLGRGSSCRSAGWRGISDRQQTWSRESQAASRAARQAGSKRKAPWESWDVLMGATAFGKQGRGKQQMKKTSWVRPCHFCSISLWVGAFYVPCPICALSHLRVNKGCPGKVGSEGGLRLPY